MKIVKKTILKEKGRRVEELRREESGISLKKLQNGGSITPVLWNIQCNFKNTHFNKQQIKQEFQRKVQTTIFSKLDSETDTTLILMSTTTKKWVFCEIL